MRLILMFMVTGSALSAAAQSGESDDSIIPGSMELVAPAPECAFMDGTSLEFGEWQRDPTASEHYVEFDLPNGVVSGTWTRVPTDKPAPGAVTLSVANTSSYVLETTRWASQLCRNEVELDTCIAHSGPGDGAWLVSEDGITWDLPDQVDSHMETDLQSTTTRYLRFGGRLSFGPNPYDVEDGHYVGTINVSVACSG